MESAPKIDPGLFAMMESSVKDDPDVVKASRSSPRDVMRSSMRSAVRMRNTPVYPMHAERP